MGRLSDRDPRRLLNRTGGQALPAIETRCPSTTATYLGGRRPTALHGRPLRQAGRFPSDPGPANRRTPAIHPDTGTTHGAGDLDVRRPAVRCRRINHRHRSRPTHDLTRHGDRGVASPAWPRPNRLEHGGLARRSGVLAQVGPAAGSVPRPTRGSSSTTPPGRPRSPIVWPNTRTGPRREHSALPP